METFFVFPSILTSVFWPFSQSIADNGLGGSVLSVGTGYGTSFLLYFLQPVSHGHGKSCEAKQERSLFPSPMAITCCRGISRCWAKCSSASPLLARSVLHSKLQPMELVQSNFKPARLATAFCRSCSEGKNWLIFRALFPRFKIKARISSTGVQGAADDWKKKGLHIAGKVLETV